MPRGIKLCPSCKAHNGPRALVCTKCNHQFFKKEKKTQEKKTIVESKSDEEQFTVVYAIAGKHPIKLTYDGEQPESYEIADWVNAVRHHGKTNGKYYTNRCIRHMLQQYIDVHSREYQTAIAPFANDDDYKEEDDG